MLSTTTTLASTSFPRTWDSDSSGARIWFAGYFNIAEGGSLSARLWPANGFRTRIQSASGSRLIAIHLLIGYKSWVSAPILDIPI